VADTKEAEALENIQGAIREYLVAVDDILQETPEAKVREVDVIVRDTGLTIDEFRELL
jgi:hypothetical protein